MLKGSSCLCEVRTSGASRRRGDTASLGAARRRRSLRRRTRAAGRRRDGKSPFVKVADAGNAQLDELAARAQHLARLFFVLSSPRRRLFLGGPLAGNRRDDGSFSFLRWTPRVKVRPDDFGRTRPIPLRAALASFLAAVTLQKRAPVCGAETDALFSCRLICERRPAARARSGREPLSGVPIRRTTLWKIRGGFWAENPANYRACETQ